MKTTWLFSSARCSNSKAETLNPTPVKQLCWHFRFAAWTWLWVVLISLTPRVSLNAQIAGGSALSISGTNDYASVTLNESLTNYTISAWVYLRSGGVFANPRVAVASSTTCGTTTEFLIRGSSSTNDPQYLQLGRCFQYEGATSTLSVPLNTWVQVSVSVTNQGASNWVSFYINGAAAGSTFLDASNNISLGPNLALGYNNGTSRKFDGLLDEVQIWRGAAVPITDHVLNGAETNLLVYYRFDEGIGGSSKNLAYENGAGSATLQGAATWTNMPAPPAPPGSPIVGGDWIPRGPSPAAGDYTSTGVLIPPDYATAGNIRTVAAHPSDPNIIYLGAVNGGVWKTVTATSTNPTWIPLTDYERSLSVSSLVFDPVDITYQTLLAGIGNYSAFGVSGALNGLLRTTNGGVTWQPISPTNLVNVSLISAAARGNVLLAASAESGLYRSTNAGATFVNLAGSGSGLPPGGVDGIVGVPGNLGRLYAASRANGIYRSDDYGANWINTASTISNSVTGCGAATLRVALAVHYSASAGEVVYVAVANPTTGDAHGRNTRTYIFFSTNSGGNWSYLGPVQEYPAEGYYLYGGPLTLSLGADPTNGFLAYVGGSYGKWGGEIIRIDRSLSSFTNLFPDGYPPDPNLGRTTHADSHVITFDASGNLIQSDDGGIFMLPYQDASAGAHGLGPGGGWRSLLGNLQIAEIVSIAYNPRTKVILGGMQDIGVNEQEDPDSNVWQIVSGGDGGDVAIDGRGVNGRTFHYWNSSTLEPSSFTKTVYSNDQFVATTYPALHVLRGAGFTGYGAVMELNAVDPRRMVFGSLNALYESTDQGETLRSVGAFYTVSVSRMTYGGYLNGVPNPDVIWACGQKDPYPGYGSILVRTNAGVPAQILGVLVNPPLSIVANSHDWRQAYYITSTSVLQTTDTGQTWTDITANLSGGPGLRSIEFLPLASGDALVVGANDGIYVTQLTKSPRWWTRLGASLPRVIAYDLRYDPSDEILVAGTLGRGAWTYSLAGWPQTGGPGMALNLSESASNFVSTHISPALSNNYTISAWINLRSGGTFPNPRVAIVSSTNCGASAELLIRSATTNITDPQYLQLARCNVFGGTLSTTPVPLSQWVYVAVTVGPTLGSGGSVSNLVSYYVNGQLAGASYFPNVDLTIGPDLALGLNNGSIRKFDGLLDQVRIWATAISGAQIPLTMAAQPTGNPSIDNALVTSLNFDEGTGTVFQAGPGTSASMVGALNWTPSAALFQTVTSPTTEPAQNVTSSSAKLAAHFVPDSVPSWSELYFEYGPTTNYGSSLPQAIAPRSTLSLNGSGDFIASLQSVSGPQEFSIGLWFKTTSQNGGRLIGFGSSQSNASPLLDRHLYLGTDGMVRFGVFGDTYRVIAGAPACNDGRWHHAMGTFSTNGMQLYVDGIQVAANSIINPGGTNQAFGYSGYWRLGWDSMANWPGASANSYFGGSIAEAQVWSTALTPAQVAAILPCPSSGNESGLVTYYRLDEGGGSIVADSASAGGANVGFVYGAPAWMDTADFSQCYSQTVTSLEPATTYHFRAVGNNAAGAGYSADRTFTTLSPTLSGTIEGGSIRLSWPNPASGFILEQTPSLSPVAWSVLPAPYVTNGSTIQTNLPLTGGAKLFRLRRP